MKIFKAKTLNELEEISGEKEVFKNMVLELRKLSEDEKIRLQAEARADYDSRIATARGAGYRKGIEQGREEGRMQALIELVNKGILGTGAAAEQLGITEQEFIKMINV